MSDPPKKPGSLRDRIAAFENKGGSASPPAPVPAPRPKPAGGVSWKPTPRSSPTLTPAGDGSDRSAPGMSAADAKTSIGQGGSLKERMAALQGLRAFGGEPTPPPKPATEKPRWKPPPVVAVPPADAENAGTEQGGLPESGTHFQVDEQHPEPAARDEPPSEQEDAQAEPDFEEEERQRRAAIAARMARLGGARVGMGPPVLARKPEMKKAETPQVHGEEQPVEPSEERTPKAILSPPVISPSVASGESEKAGTEHFETKDDGLLTTTSGTPPGSRSPSMPVPAAPRRAAPPRKRAAKSPSPAPAEVLGQGVINESPMPIPGVSIGAASEAGPVELLGDREPEMRESRMEVLLESLHIADAGPPDATRECLAAEEAQHAIQPVEPSVAEEIVGEPLASEHRLHSETDSVHSALQPLENLVEPTAHHQEGSASSRDEAHVAASDSAFQEEEDDDARRKRIAERLAKAGGVNPLSGRPLRAPTSPIDAAPGRHQSLRRDSRDSTASFKHSESEDAVAVRRRSTDSVASRSQVPPSPPTLPTSQKPEILGRKGSIGSVKSNVSIEPPVRRMSQDDPRILTAHIAGHPEATSTAAPIDRGIPDEEGGGEIDPHGPYEATHDLQSVAEEEERLHGNDIALAYLSEPEQLTYDGGDGISITHHEVDEYGFEGERPTATSPTSYRTYSHELQYGGSQPHRLPVVRSHDESKRQSIPPPPRTLPLPPDNGPEMTNVGPPSVPRSIRPSVPLPETHYVKEHTLEEPASHSSRPITYLEVEEEQPVPASDREEDSYEDYEHEEHEAYEAYKPAENIQAGYSQSVNIDAFESVPADLHHDVEEDILSPPPPPPRRTSAVLSIEHGRYAGAVEEDYLDASPPSPPPLPTNSLGSDIKRTSLKGKVDTGAHATHVPVPAAQHANEYEILDDSDGDPIDPTFYKSHKSPSTTPEFDPLAPDLPTGSLATEATAITDTTEEDPEQARRRTIAERMAKLGGLRFGAPIPPPPVHRPQPHVPSEEDHPGEVVPSDNETEIQEGSEEEDEAARRQRIAARLAGMGGLRFGMLPGAVAPPRPPQAHDARELEQRQEPASESASHVAKRTVSISRPQPDPVSDDGEAIEYEESEAEEVSYEEVQDDVPPPPVPSREHRRTSPIELQRPPVPQTTRPPVPQVPVPPVSSRSGRAPSGVDASSFSYPPPPSTRPPPPSHDSHGDYVMVNKDESADEPPPPLPPPRTVSLNRAHPPPRNVPPPPQPQLSLAAVNSSEGRLEEPAIPRVDFGGETDLSLSGQWSEDSTNLPPPTPTKATSQPTTARQASASQVDGHISADDLIVIWGRVGIQIHETATVLFEKSKKSLVGDGSYLGFVTATLNQVPNAVQPVAPYDSFGHLIYAQSGSAVQRRVSDLMPGDVIILHDAKFKGHKGLQSYHQHVGIGDPLYAIIGDYEVKKSKVRVFQANQHVGQQTVESMSYRLEDLKSGTIKIFRVLEA
ncbi:uncharacterized protein FIBRA_00529 [Fibroporia radiculosa]|uniref:BBC1/AIM3 cysteine proteinase-fold domain-containing protein n=1 Tax=Fibroporia radiculosa TaxID=599839 RepID=J4GI03_9APHY|nr:uncharacterized protein FIBRA_00529 [Fibroporia radiculosa]CCL98530.1 predicted protein [Fibroporia radiculosa]